MNAQSSSQLYATIARDPRHHGLIVVWDEEEGERQFSEWSMAFRDISADQGEALPGYSSFMNPRLTAEEFGRDPSLTEQLLLSFKQTLNSTTGSPR